MSSEANMIRLGTKPRLLPYLRDVWERRQFATAIAAGEVRAQSMDTVLGNLWQVLNPLFLAGVYYLMFGVLLGVDRGVDNYIAFLIVGIFVFHYTQKSVMAGARSIVANEGLIRSVHFPRAVLPISTVIGQTINFLPAVGIMLVIAIATGEIPDPIWALLLPLFALQALGNLGAAFVVARMTDRVRDVQYVLPYVFRVAFYLSGVLFSVDAFVPDRYRPLFDFNPLFVYVTAARGVVLDETVLVRYWVYAAAWSFGLAVLGLLYFRNAEHEYGRG